jgi:hypothetical protein
MTRRKVLRAVLCTCLYTGRLDSDSEELFTYSCDLQGVSSKVVCRRCRHAELFGRAESRHPLRSFALANLLSSMQIIQKDDHGCISNCLLSVRPSEQSWIDCEDIFGCIKPTAEA